MQADAEVWIIDDDRSIRWVFEKALTRENIAFKTFASAREALAALEDEVPQVVVSDIRMPGESGLELLQKAKERHSNLPVIIVSYKEREEDRMLGLEVGANYYLTKSSFHDNRFIRAVEDLLGVG